MLFPNTILQERYRVVRELGHGGMGYVYEAIDQRVNCIVAIKETMTSDNAESRRAFEREAALLANLRHRGLPKVMDYFSENEGDFLVMEFIAGRDLAELLDARGRAFSQSEVLHCGDELLSILVYLHSHEPPILHRDIKPSNLKLSEDGELFLLDFGLAKGALGQMPTLVTSRSVRGYTPVYAPLEQILGQGTDPRSDLYSVAATLYHLLSAAPPVDAPTRFHATEEERPDPLRRIQDLNPCVSPDVDSIVLNAMSLSRKQRPATASEMRLALKDVADEINRQESERRRAEEQRNNRKKEEAEKRPEAETLKREPAEAQARAVEKHRDAFGGILQARPTLPAPPPQPFSFDSATERHDGTTRPAFPWRWTLVAACVVFAIAIAGIILLYGNPFAGVTANRNASLASAASNESLQPTPTAQASPTQAPSPSPIVARTINPPRDFLEFAKSEDAYTEDSVHVREVDLDLDGVPELIAQYQTCGSGGCFTHVLRRNGSSFHDIGGGVGEYMMPPLNRSSVQAGPTMMNGYLDIKYDRQYFTFDGRQYQCARGC